MIIVKQIAWHERTAFGALLTMAAGGLDAYSYLEHGEVFAGLQTGNLILFGIQLGQGYFAGSVRYLISLAAFFIGTIIVRALQEHAWLGAHDKTRRETIVLYAAALLLVSAAISPWVSDQVATVFLSIAAAAELQEFRRLNAGPFTPLMMTGNLRTLADSFFSATWRHDAAASQQLRRTGTIMLTFAIGAGLVAFLRQWMSEFTVVVPAVGLLIAWGYLLMTPAETGEA